MLSLRLLIAPSAVAMLLPVSAQTPSGGGYRGPAWQVGADGKSYLATAAGVRGEAVVPFSPWLAGPTPFAAGSGRFGNVMADMEILGRQGALLFSHFCLGPGQDLASACNVELHLASTPGGLTQDRLRDLLAGTIAPDASPAGQRRFALERLLAVRHCARRRLVEHLPALQALARNGKGDPFLTGAAREALRRLGKPVRAATRSVPFAPLVAQVDPRSTWLVMVNSGMAPPMEDLYGLLNRALQVELLDLDQPPRNWDPAREKACQGELYFELARLLGNVRLDRAILAGGGRGDDIPNTLFATGLFEMPWLLQTLGAYNTSKVAGRFRCRLPDKASISIDQHLLSLRLERAVTTKPATTAPAGAMSDRLAGLGVGGEQSLALAILERPDRILAGIVPTSWLGELAGIQQLGAGLRLAPHIQLTCTLRFCNSQQAVTFAARAGRLLDPADLKRLLDRQIAVSARIFSWLTRLGPRCISQEGPLVRFRINLPGTTLEKLMQELVRCRARKVSRRD